MAIEKPGKSPAKWIYLSPHLDDAALSCGGIIAEQVRQDIRVEVWTIFAGDPPDGELTPFARSLHTRWKTDRTAAAVRRREDLRACARLGAEAVHFHFPDCIYRRFPGTLEPVIIENDDLFKPLHAGEMGLVRQVQQLLQELIPPGTVIVLPLTVGDHVDHQITRLAGEGVSAATCYYPEYPYITRAEKNLQDKMKTGWKETSYEFGGETLLAWQEAVAEYQSQISTFWENTPAMYAAILQYGQAGGGSHLWCAESRPQHV